MNSANLAEFRRNGWLAECVSGWAVKLGIFSNFWPGAGRPRQKMKTMPFKCYITHCISRCIFEVVIKSVIQFLSIFKMIFWSFNRKYLSVTYTDLSRFADQTLHNYHNRNSIYFRTVSSRGAMAGRCTSPSGVRMSPP